MGVVNPRAVLTYEDYLCLPAGLTHQLLDGELYCMTPAPTPYHQRISSRLQIALDAHVEAHGLGMVFDAPIDVILSEHNVAQPDLLFIAQARLDIIHENGIFGCPDLVIEILSPSTSRIDRMVKFAIYNRFGAREYWIIDPARPSLERYTRRGESGDLELDITLGPSERLSTPLFPGLSLELKPIFAWKD